MKIYVLSRREDEARRKALLGQLEELGLKYELFFSVKPREDEIARKKMRRVLRVLSDGEIGCAAGHQAIYRKMLEEGIEEACVLEDDARLVGGRLKAEVEAEKRVGADAPRAVLLTARAPERIWTIGYLINLSGARAMIKYNSPIWRVADCWESVARRGLVKVDWSESAAVEPNEKLASVITPSGVPPHKILLPMDPFSRIKRAFWRMTYGVGQRI